MLLVSHDRDFLDNVVTSTLVMEGEGRIGEYVGGYTDWLRQRPASVLERATTPIKPAPALEVASPEPTVAPAKKKLGYKEARELEALPGRIDALETEIAERTERMNAPGYFQRDPADVGADNAAPVSYTHLDVYKRQLPCRWRRSATPPGYVRCCPARARCIVASEDWGASIR